MVIRKGKNDRDRETNPRWRDVKQETVARYSVLFKQNRERRIIMHTLEQRRAKEREERKIDGL